QEWAIAEAIARELAPNVDRNELGKALSYFQRTRSKTKFLKLLDRLPRSGYTRSSRTRDYLNRIAATCQRHLAPITDDHRALAIVSWSFRLMTHQQTLGGQRSAQGRPQSRRR
ncbi:MAG: hypothetical protein KKC18_11200, partial [Chloroflexi bacterium]|nr:hypothetical protein [Chloroflexota bacterium]